MKILILAGGSGSRLWPLSRSTFPKQFLRFGQKHSLLQKTLLRFLAAYPPEDFVIITQNETFDLVKAEVGEIDSRLKERIAIEPSQKNTAPAILFALDWLKKRGEECNSFLVAPSDHLISPEDVFLEKVSVAKKVAEEGHIVTFGVYPSHPHTGYGYIQCRSIKDISDVEEFIEKPSLPKAQNMLASGNCLWNAGIFVFQTKRFLEEIRLHQKEMIEAYEGNLEEAFASLPSLSIDYALIEHSRSLKVIPLELSWSDVGSWDSIHEAFEKDAMGNVTMGNVTLEETHNCLIFGQKKLVATVDVEDLLIVDSEDALLVAKKGSSQKIRGLVQKLMEKGQKEAIEHPTAHRPWGSYTILEEGIGYKIKHIIVSPQQSLSLQYHLHRSEHWVVIEGEATIILGEEEIALTENESIFVPKEMPHRLMNKTETLLEIIEVQVGDYVGEDDIIRLDDVYGRTEKSLAKT